MADHEVRERLDKINSRMEAMMAAMAQLVLLLCQEGRLAHSQAATEQDQRETCSTKTGRLGPIGW